jgi:alpha-1,6-mannosyltransferase
MNGSAGFCLRWERQGPRSGRELALQSSALRVRIHLFGIVVLAAYLVLALLSYLQAPAIWRNHPAAPQAVAFFNDFAARYPVIAFHRLFENNLAAIISYWIPAAFATVAVLALLLLLPRWERALDAAVATVLMRWSVVFAVVTLFAFPVFTQDFWLSMAWGRMVAEGMNPFHALFTAEQLTGLPLDHFPMAMSYGPAWAILSGVVMGVSGQSVLAATILFKLVLLAAWLGTLFLIPRITEKRSLLDRCLAIAIFGWLPAGVLQTVAEGHNDVVMVWPALLWLALLLQGRWTAPVALVVSALCKYVTGPLFVLDAIAAWRMHGLAWRQLILRYVVPGVVGLAVFALFFRSMAFFDGARVISEWHFLQPRDAIAAFELTFNVKLYPVAYLITVGFAILVAYYLVTLFKQPEPENVVKAALALLSAISFVGIAHLWPWYLVWTLAFAAVLPRWWLSRFVIGVSILAPMTLAVWWVELFPNAGQWAALAMYVLGALWCLLTRTPATMSTRERSPDPVTGGSFGHP